MARRNTVPVSYLHVPYFLERFLVVFTKFRGAVITFVMSVSLSGCLSAWNNSAPTERIGMKFHILAFFENLSRMF